MRRRVRAAAIGERSDRSRRKRAADGGDEDFAGRRNEPPGARSTDCRAQRAEAARSAAEAGEDDMDSLPL